MNRKNAAAFLTATQQLEIRDCEMPKVAPDEVLLKIEYIGICGSDAHFFESGKRKETPLPFPFILGHEASATVVELGADVKTLTVGDRVCIEPQKTCGECEMCKTGHYNMCPSVEFPSVPPYDGMLRKYFAFPARLCHKLPDSMTLEQGALIEPLAVGLSAAEEGEVRLGDTVVILGMGTIGLVTLLACKARGATKIVAIDLFDERLECAEKLGATMVINGGKEDAVAKVMEYTDGRGADVVFETAGSAFTAAQSAEYLRRCGRVVLVGNINGTTQMKLFELMLREGSIHTIYRYKNNFPTAISSVATGVINVNSLITNVYPMAEAQKAFEQSIHDKSHVIKILLKVAED